MNGIDAVKTDAQLTAIAALVGIRNGFDEAKAEFSPFRDFKIKWTRSYKWISFEVSDYLRDAPEDVITDLFTTIFRKIKGDEATVYTEKVTEWLTTSEFADRMRPTFLKRCRGYDDDEGWIAESIGRLRDKGLEIPENIVCGTVSSDRSRSIGKSSALMRVVIMNPLVNELDENARDFAVWTQVARVSMGLSRDGERYEELLDMYPGREDAENRFRVAFLHI